MSDIKQNEEPRGDVALKIAWVRACDSFDNSERAATVLADRLGSSTLREAMESKMTCGCSRGFLYQVEIRVTKLVVKTATSSPTTELASIPQERDPRLNEKIEALDLPACLTKVLDPLHLLYVGSLVQLREYHFLRLPKAGRKSLKILKEILAGRGLWLGSSTEGWVPPHTLVFVNGARREAPGLSLRWERVMSLYNESLDPKFWKVIYRRRGQERAFLLSPGDSIDLEPGLEFTVERLSHRRKTSP